MLHKSVLTFILSGSDENGHKFLSTSLWTDSSEVGFFQTPNKTDNPLERFRVEGNLFSLYKMVSPSGERSYYVLALGDGPRAESLTLIQDDSSSLKAVDSRDYNTMGIDFEIDTLNHCDVGRIIWQTHGTGYIRYREEYIVGEGDKFKTIFLSITTEAFDTSGDSTTIILRKINFEDLNRDGLRDIREEEVVETIPPRGVDLTWEQYVYDRDLDAFYRVKSEYVVSRKQTKYYWNKFTHSFDHMNEE
jgi:hypothetical protein